MAFICGVLVPLVMLPPSHTMALCSPLAAVTAHCCELTTLHTKATLVNHHDGVSESEFAPHAYTTYMSLYPQQAAAVMHKVAAVVLCTYAASLKSSPESSFAVDEHQAV